jgi:hypothetical protein
MGLKVEGIAVQTLAVLYTGANRQQDASRKEIRYG